MFVQGKNNVFDLDWNNRVKYKSFLQAEKEFSAYNFGFANTDTLLKNFEASETECKSLLEKIVFACLRPMFEGKSFI